MKSKLFLTINYMAQGYQFLKRGRFKKLRLFSENSGFGMNELLSIAAALILAAFIVIPGLKTFASSVMDGLEDWWTNTIDSQIFPSS